MLTLSLSEIPIFSGSEAAYSLALVSEASEIGTTLGAVLSSKEMDSSWMLYIFLWLRILMSRLAMLVFCLLPLDFPCLDIHNDNKLMPKICTKGIFEARQVVNLLRATHFLEIAAVNSLGRGV